MSESVASEPAASLQDVSFSYGRRVVFDGLSIAFGGGVTGLLGPNGAGKSTLMTLLATHRQPRSGTVEVLGHDASTVAGREYIRSTSGYLAQRYPLVGSMKVVDTLAYAAWTRGVARSAAYVAAEAVMDRLGIAGLQGRRVRGLSGGERQRVGLAAAMVHQPSFLVLDEPTAGLDPLVRMSIRSTLRSFVEAGSGAVLLSTHLVDDVLTACDSVIVIEHGRVLFTGTPGELAACAPAASETRSASPLELGYEAVLHEGRVDARQ